MTSSAMTVAPTAASIPPTSLALKSNVAKAIWYPCHEGTGTTLAEKLGLGSSLTLTEGVAGGGEWTNWGYVTPSGSSQFASALGNSYLQALMRMDTLGSGQILIGGEIAHDGDLTTNEALFGYGRSQNAVGCRGHMSLRMGSSESWIFVTHGGEGASAAVNTSIGGTGTTGVTDKQSFVLSINLQTGSTFALSMYRYIDNSGYQLVRSTTHDALAGGGYVPQGDESSVLCLFAIQTAATPTYSTFMGAAAGSNAKVNNFWAARLTTLDLDAGQRCLDSMVAAPREFPLYLRQT